jgi:prophage DNA circulation protein
MAQDILQLQSGIAWRRNWKPAMFRDKRFHVDANVRESGRRIVNHEFPKRDINYAEDMGKRAREFTVRGYIIVYPRDTEGALQKKNYIPARNQLIEALEQEGPGTLQLPLLGSMQVVCQRYRVTEETRLGGYCTFDMTFTEYGKAPAEGSRQSSGALQSSAADLGAAVKQAVTQQIDKIAT